MPYIESDKSRTNCFVREELLFTYTSTWCYPVGKDEGHQGITEKINLRKAITELTILMNANFVPGDYHITLTYERDKRAETVEEAKRDRKIFLDRLRRRMKKKKKEICKYIVVTEVGVRGALHHHMVMNQVPVEWIRQAWKHGRIDIRPLDDTGQYSKLAKYFCQIYHSLQRTWRERSSLDKKQKSFFSRRQKRK